MHNLPQAQENNSPVLSYDLECEAGAALARSLIMDFNSSLKNKNYDGAERHALGDILLKSNPELSGIAVGFGYELMSIIEMLILRR